MERPQAVKGTSGRGYWQGRTCDMMYLYYAAGGRCTTQQVGGVIPCGHPSNPNLSPCHLTWCPCCQLFCLLGILLVCVYWSALIIWSWDYIYIYVCVWHLVIHYTDPDDGAGDLWSLKIDTAEHPRFLHIYSPQRLQILHRWYDIYTENVCHTTENRDGALWLST
jgi:hypothetical protein